MPHEIAKLMLEHAGTFLERTEAIKVALSLGMPLREIEAYLDWLDTMRPHRDVQGDVQGDAEEAEGEEGEGDRG
jgi:DNA-binding transcriptional MerR regulator